MSAPIVARITEGALSLSMADELASPGDGAVACFLGTVRVETGGRAVTSLEYESYAELAHDQLRDIAERAVSRWGLGGVMLVHRVGRLEVGEASVLVAVSAPHRQEAFDACRWLIDTLKETVAIWKKETFADGGEQWVEHA